MSKDNILIIGASSAIAQAVVLELLAAKSNTNIIIISRDLSTYDNITSVQLTKILIDDYQPSTIENTVNEIRKVENLVLKQIYICHGLLHNHVITPEKRIEDFCAESFLSIVQVNALTPILWIKALVPLLTSKEDCRLVVFSARVGSIEDNNLGGWYSYRASKSALNMMLKNVAIELSRRSKNTKVIIFHPGTTDTKLSKPFQKNVPEGKLFTAKFVAQQLLKIIAVQAFDQKASFLDWQGKEIKW